ncbi:MAG: hypothetical protein IJ880_03745 [Bacilli bacterium]|nr:hypothetical protein [Bacilli bacterium]MBR3119800.1 hypothetical protein [Oceanobacillus sp.]
MLFNKSFRIKTWGEDDNEVIDYLEYNAKSIQTEIIKKVEDKDYNSSCHYIYIIKAKSNKRDYNKLKVLGDIHLC